MSFFDADALFCFASEFRKVYLVVVRLLVVLFWGPLIFPPLILFIANTHCLLLQIFRRHNSPFRAVLCACCPLFFCYLLAFRHLASCCVSSSVFLFLLPIFFTIYFDFPSFWFCQLFLALDNLFVLALFRVSRACMLRMLFMYT